MAFVPSYGAEALKKCEDSLQRRNSSSSSSSGEDFHGHGPPQPSSTTATLPSNTTMPTLTSPLSRANGGRIGGGVGAGGFDSSIITNNTSTTNTNNPLLLTPDNIPNMLASVDSSVGITMRITHTGQRGGVHIDVDDHHNDEDDDDDDTGSTISSSAASSTVGHSSSKTIAATSGFNNVGFAAMKRVDMYYDDVEDVSTDRTGHKYVEDDDYDVGDLILDDDANAILPPPGFSKNFNRGSSGDSCGSFASVPLPSSTVAGGSLLRRSHRGGEGGAAPHEDLLCTPGDGSTLRRSNSASMTMFGQGAINIEAARMRKAALRPTIDLASINQRQQQQ